MSDGERLGSGQSMNRNLPRNRTPPRPSSELPQLTPSQSGGIQWLDPATGDRATDASSSPPAPRSPARPPRPRRPSNQRPVASPPDEAFPRLADGRVIQVPTQEIVGQVPQTDVAAERATVGQRGTEPNNQTPTPRNNGTRQDEALPPMSFNPSQTILEIVQGTNRLIEQEERHNQERIQRFWGQFTNQSIDPLEIQLEFNRWFGSRRTTSPAIESARRQLEAARRQNLLADGGSRLDIRDARQFLSDLSPAHQTAPYARELGILIGIAEEGLELVDGILALPESIAELISLLPRLGSIYMDFQRLPEDAQVQVLGALAREGANVIFGEIIRLAQESIQDAINGRTLDANRKATRAIIKVVGLVTVFKSAIRFLRRSPEIFRSISGKIDDLGRRGRRLADSFQESLRDLRADEVGSIGGFPELRHIIRNLQTRLNRRVRGRTTKIHDYIQKLLNRERNIVSGSSFEVVRRRLTPDEVQSLIDSVFNFYDRVGGRLSNDADTFLELLKNFTDTRVGGLRTNSTISRPAAGELRVLTQFLHEPNVRTVRLVPQGRGRSPDMIITPNRGSPYRVEVRTMDSFFARANPNQSVEALRRAILDKIERGQLTAPLGGRLSRTPQNGDIAIVVPRDPRLYPLIDQAMEGFSFPPGINKIHFFAGDNIFTFTPQ